MIVSLPLLTSNLSYSMREGTGSDTVTIRTTDETQIKIARLYLPYLRAQSDSKGMITITTDADTFNTAVMPGLEIGLAQRRYTQTLEGLPIDILAKTFETGCLLQSKEIKKNVFDVLRARMKQNDADFRKCREKENASGVDGCESGSQQESPRKNVSDMSGVDIAEVLKKHQEFLEQREKDRQRNIVSTNIVATINLNIEEFLQEGLESLEIPRSWWSEIFDELESDLNQVKQNLIFADMLQTVQQNEEREKEQEQIRAADKSKQKLREIIDFSKVAELIKSEIS